MASTGYRRGTGSGKKWPFDAEDSANGNDDKQMKSDETEVHTGRFVVGLLIACCIACAYLMISHMGRSDVSISGATQVKSVPNQPIMIERPLAVNTGISQPAINIEDNKRINTQGKTKSGNSGGETAQRLVHTKVELGVATSAQRRASKPADITWPGCQYELPDPNVAPAYPVSTTRPLRNKKNAPGYDYNRKHIVPPPAGEVTLVCCNTTKGPLNIEVHPTWAPNGAARFLEMVNEGFFASDVGLFRALKDFLVQFGLPGDPELLKKYHQQGNLMDDPPWLPLGPTGREINGTKRFQKGYLAYAGAGKNSRGTQLIMAFQDNLYLGGGSPWEVPFAQVFGASSFETLGKIFTGYGEKPSQGKIMNRGNAYLREEFPLMDYINNCAVTREHVAWSYVHPHPYQP